MCEGDIIEVRDLPALMRFSALRESTVTRPLVEIELDHIRSVLASVEGNRSQRRPHPRHRPQDAAREAQVPLRSLAPVGKNSPSTLRPVVQPDPVTILTRRPRPTRRGSGDRAVRHRPIDKGLFLALTLL